MNNLPVMKPTGSTGLPTRKRALTSARALAARLDATFAALADPTRRAILERLAAGEATVMELAAPFAMSQPAVSKHLKVLERAGLITRGREAQRRPCRLEAGPLAEVAAWAERYRRFWDGRFDALEEYVQTLQAKETGHGGRKQPGTRGKAGG